MIAFLRSSARFLWRVALRASPGIAWWLLDAAGVYARLVAPRLPAEWAAWLKPAVPWFAAATPWVVAVFLLWAVLYTYYEIDPLRSRHPRTTRRLKEFYARSAELLERPVEGRDELERLRADTNGWYAEAVEWIEDHTEPATLARFKHRSVTLPYLHGEPKIAGHQQLLDGINVFHHNLLVIIENPEWR